MSNQKQDQKQKDQSKTKKLVIGSTEKLLSREGADTNTILIKELHSKLKMLEFSNIKNLKDVRQAIAFTASKTKERLESTSLSNKHKAEIILIAQIEAHKIVESLLEAIENL